MNIKQTLIIICFTLVACFNKQSLSPNYNENNIKPYAIPDVLYNGNGQQISNFNEWEEIKKKKIITDYKNEVYGKIPSQKIKPTSIAIIEQSNDAINNNAIRKQIAIKFNGNDKEITINVLLYLPKHIKSPNIFMGYNFYGNQTISKDSCIILPNSWVKNNKELGITDNYATDKSRGQRVSRWPVKKMIKEGFGIATVYYGDIDPDKNDFTDGIHPLFYNKNQQQPNKDEWGSISAWAWGCSNVLDYLKEDKHTKNSKFILFGHSRLGKTSLWAGSLDSRFDMVISNNSGCGGAALFRRKYGETVSIINHKFPHWFSKNFQKYNDKEETLPIDQHMLIALIAPRPVYITSAKDDRWADPKGEYLSGYYASLVYELYGKVGFISPKPPKYNTPIHHSIGYHIRKGEHDVTNYDWEQFITFANKHLN